MKEYMPLKPIVEDAYKQAVFPPKVISYLRVADDMVRLPERLHPELRDRQLDILSEMNLQDRIALTMAEEARLKDALKLARKEPLPISGDIFTPLEKARVNFDAKRFSKFHMNRR